ncbi:MAG: peptide chain release factor 1 [Nitrospirota bacterium]|jgi:peptide chain release factor 1
MLEKLDAIEKRYEELNLLLTDPEVIRNQRLLQTYSKEQSDLAPVVRMIEEYKKALLERQETRELLKSPDKEMRELAREELHSLEERAAALEEKLKLALIPKDPRDEKNVILEIRAGTGGEEAGLFAADLFRMYSKYAESRGWKVEVMESSPTGVGGIKEIIATITGARAYSRLKYESGVHRVQRVPQTEAQGRIHTSAATVAVLPEAEDVDVKLEEKDLRTDTFCASGPGGQGVNTTYSAVRIVHIPTGLTVQCQDGRSQIKNKEKALKVLRARLYEMEQEAKERERAEHRKAQVGTGDRSERIRTYNFPQNRVTDHRVGLTLHRLEEVLGGNLDELIDQLDLHFQAEKLKTV